MGQNGGASRWRVCYQRGLPRLVFVHQYPKLVLTIHIDPPDHKI